MEKARHHYVPRFYLRNFSICKRRISLYVNASNRFVEHASIKDQAFKHHLYGSGTDVEEFLAYIEDQVAPIIKGIIDTDKLPLADTIEYQSILYFMILSHARDTRHADSVNTFLDAQMKQIFTMEKKHGVDNLDGIDISDYKISFDMPNLYSIQDAHKTLSYILDLKTLLIISDCDRLFITSDSPMTKYNAFFVERGYANLGYGYGSVGIQLFLPISPRHCLLVYDGIMYKALGSVNGVIHINKSKTIDEMNRLFYLNSYNFLYFCPCTSFKYIEKIVTENIEKKKTRKLITKFGSEDSMFIGFHPHQVVSRVNIPYLQIDPRYYSIPFLNQLSGPLRPYVIRIMQKEGRFKG